MAPTKAEAFVTLANANTSRSRASRGGNSPTKQFIDQVQQSLPYQNNGAEFAYTTPCLMAAITATMIAATDRKASDIVVRPASGDWKYFKTIQSNSTLSAVLQCVASQGYQALTIDPTMTSQLDKLGGEADRNTNQVVRMVMELPETAHLIEDQGDNVLSVYERCYESVNEIEKAFDAWLLSIVELHASIIKMRETSEADAEAKNMLNLKADLEALSQATSFRGPQAEQAAKDLNKCLNMIQDLLLKANDNTTKAWNASMKSVSKALVEAAPLILAQFLPAMSGAVTGLERTDVSATAKTLISAVADRGPPSDPAYTAALLLAPILNELHACLFKDNNGGLDWSKLKDDNGAGVCWLRESTKVLQNMSLSGTSEPSGVWKTALDKIVRTIDAISNSPEASPDKVASWREDVADAKLKLLQLCSTAECFPAAARGRDYSEDEDFTQVIQRADASAQTAAFNAAIEKFIISKQVLQTAQQISRSAANKAKKVKEDFKVLNSKFQDSQSESDLLKRAADILANSTTALIHYKLRLARLKALFGGAMNLTRLVLLERARRGSQTDFNGQQCIRTLEINTLISLTLQLNALNNVGRNMSRLEVEVQSRSLAQARYMLANILQAGSEDPRMAQNMGRNIFQMASECARTIDGLADKQQRDPEEKLNDGISAIDSQMQELERSGVPKLDASSAAAIERGGAVVTDFVAKRMS
ncbi:hypothetical protein ACN47E_009263 [Coniothyrium glycines]